MHRGEKRKDYLRVVVVFWDDTSKQQAKPLAGTEASRSIHLEGAKDSSTALLLCCVNLSAAAAVAVAMTALLKLLWSKGLYCSDFGAR